MMSSHNNGSDGDRRYDDPEFERDRYSRTDGVHHDEVEELGLVDEHESLPWLESNYDEEPQSIDAGRIIGFLLLGLVALALIFALVWYFLSSRTNSDLQPEGTTIAAPEGPIKERPENAGGQTFEGTGNVAPNVGEGRTTEGRLGEDDDSTPEPSIDVAVGAPSPDPQPAEPATPSGIGVQVGAYNSRAAANTGWAVLRGQTDVLNGVKNRIVQGVVDGSTVYRLQAVAADEPAADRLCNALKDDGLACQVKR